MKGPTPEASPGERGGNEGLEGGRGKVRRGHF